LQQSKEIVRLVKIGVLEEFYSSQWDSASPSFTIPKENKSKRVVTDLVLKDDYSLNGLLVTQYF
jgi:hypothetical protein